MSAQDYDSISIFLQPMIVTANRIPAALRFINRSVDITTEFTLRNSAITTIEDALQQSSNVNVQARGPFGVQNDISIRGTLFSQSVLLINGTRIDDPQTAHHNFNFIVSPDMIERIEILRGPGSAQYGANAFGGVINFITKTPDRTSAALQIESGQYGLFCGTASAAIAGSSFRSINSIGYRKSDGYHEDTDFSLVSFCTSNEISTALGPISLFGGFTQKEFGAFDFYSPGLHKPSREWTKTAYFNLELSQSISSVKILPKLSYRRNNDRFQDDQRLSNININDHTTQVFQFELSVLSELSDKISITGGTDISFDDITSNVYGKHQRSDGGIFISTLVNLQYWTIDCALRIISNSENGTVFCPSAGIGYLLGETGKIYITAGRAFRAPAFTELYIHTPQISGNSGLRPEIGWTYEIGSTYLIQPSTQFSAAIFRNEQKDLIDYVKFSSGDIFHAVNFTSARIQGAEASVQWNGNNFSDDKCELKHASLSYGYLDSRIERDSVFAARYSFIHPRHQIALSAFGVLPLSLTGSISLIHKIKIDGSAYSILDARIAKTYNLITLSISGTNLLNHSYEEIAGVPLPGRWLWAGLKYNIF